MLTAEQTPPGHVMGAGGPADCPAFHAPRRWTGEAGSSTPHCQLQQLSLPAPERAPNQGSPAPEKHYPQVSPHSSEHLPDPRAHCPWWPVDTRAHIHTQHRTQNDHRDPPTATRTSLHPRPEQGLVLVWSTREPQDVAGGGSHKKPLKSGGRRGSSNRVSPPLSPQGLCTHKSLWLKFPLQHQQGPAQRTRVRPHGGPRPVTIICLSTLWS